MSVNENEDKKWYVLHTRSRFENVVRSQLEKKGVCVFLPTMIKLSRRKDRKKTIEVPMFPGYVFVQCDSAPENRLKILKTTGAVKLIGTKSGPIPVKKEAVESLILFSESRSEVFTVRGFKKGQDVIIMGGAMTGVKGIFEKEAGKARVVVQIDILGRYAYAEVDEDDIEFLDPSAIIT